MAGMEVFWGVHVGRAIVIITQAISSQTVLFLTTWWVWLAFSGAFSLGLVFNSAVGREGVLLVRGCMSIPNKRKADDPEPSLSQILQSVSNLTAVVTTMGNDLRSDINKQNRRIE
eukprot:2560572-Amphidinium_carterae.1